jgi:hypothetical protein
MSELKIEKARRDAVKLSIVLSGPSGAGKTFSALTLASGMGKNIILIDSEKKRSKIYARHFAFDVIQLSSPYTPERYREVIKLAKTKNPDVIIVDSATHEWMGNGGILQEVDSVDPKNKMIKWANVTPRHDKYTESLSSETTCHMIVTLRAREKYMVTEVIDDSGKKKMGMKRLGLRPIQRKDFLYDFILCFTLDPDTHEAQVLKQVEGAPKISSEKFLITKDFGRQLLKWAETGDDAVTKEEVASAAVKIAKGRKR